MASKNKNKATPGKSKSKGKAATSKKTRKRAPPATSSRTQARMIVRRNAAPARAITVKPEAQPKVQDDAQDDTERTALTERIEDMGGSHVAAGIGAGALGNVLGVIAVGQGWIGPKLTAGILMGTGAAATAAGWYWEWDHMMAAGVGVSAAGAFSIANQLSIDAYEAMEKRAEEKRDRKQAEEVAKQQNMRLAEARALLQSEQRKQRNARRIVVLDQDGEIIDTPEFAIA